MLLETSQIKHLCVLTYQTEDPEVLRQGAIAADTPLESLPAAWLDILVAIAFARRHLAVLQLLIEYPPPAPKSILDIITPSIIRRRSGSEQTFFEHWAQPPDAKLFEIQTWLAILEAESGWVHFPLNRGDKGLYRGLCSLLYLFPNTLRLRTHPDVERLCRVFSKLGICPNSATISRFLSASASPDDMPRGVKACPLHQATMLLECCPVASIAASESKNG